MALDAGADLGHPRPIVVDSRSRGTHVPATRLDHATGTWGCVRQKRSCGGLRVVGGVFQTAATRQTDMGVAERGVRIRPRATGAASVGLVLDLINVYLYSWSKLFRVSAPTRS